MPIYPRGCYLSISDRGNLKAVLQEYAEAHLERDEAGVPQCDCIVFSDGGRILGLGDLAAWGMGIPIGKLDLYTVCGGLNPRRTIPVILDAGCSDPCGNTAKLTIRDHKYGPNGVQLTTGLGPGSLQKKSCVRTPPPPCPSVLRHHGSDVMLTDDPVVESSVSSIESPGGADQPDFVTSDDDTITELARMSLRPGNTDTGPKFSLRRKRHGYYNGQHHRLTSSTSEVRFLVPLTCPGTCW